MVHLGGLRGVRGAGGVHQGIDDARRAPVNLQYQALQSLITVKRRTRGAGKTPGLEIQRLEQGLLIEVAENRRPPVRARAVAGHDRAAPRADGEAAVRLVVVVHGQAKLLEIVGALAAACRFPGRLDRRQEQSDQNSDDRNHHQ